MFLLHFIKIILDITIAPLIIRLTGLFELNINTRSNISNSLQPLIGQFD